MLTSINAFSSNFSKLIIQTKYGGVPFLNDYLVSLFDFNLFNIKFSELLNYLDLFDKYNDFLNNKQVKTAEITSGIKQNNHHKLLSQYFKLSKVYLSFTEFTLINSTDIGSSQDNVYYVNTNTGKSKVTTDEFVKYLNLFNPEFCEIPYEMLPNDCGKKRVLRCYKKIEKFLSTLEKLGSDVRTQIINYETDGNHLIRNTKILIPIYLNHLDKFPIENINQIILKYKHLIKGFFLFNEDYRNLSADKIKNYKEILNKLIEIFDKTEIFVNSSNGHPIELMLSQEMGCNYFQIIYPFEIAEKGLAINSNFFNISDILEIETKNDIKENNDFQNLKNKEIKLIDLNDKIYETDNSIIKDGCGCFTCKNNYTKAYIHHLLKCKELNASILISMHNLHFTVKLYENYSTLQDESKRKEYLSKFLREECLECE